MSTAGTATWTALEIGMAGIDSVINLREGSTDAMWCENEWTNERTNESLACLFLHCMLPNSYSDSI